ncbi:hypothetical protein [Actinokineospora globicatena]|uniref:Uncharacterized protein n=1 Tax=Actinokineospora globicatena TaxID=103729 RepID=A0A9W6QT62_9PSEU|nr:hypothetical protein [Actinokineospora globicatena]GLW94199.1 hypothetical protein Aglo03_50150 [Actinokineospora globicatena]
MTIYSQHANRGKAQILATYDGHAGVMSSTVTSVEDPALAAPIVTALNRISACATVPVSFWDERGRGVDSYPSDHLAALTDPDARPGLLKGAHSLWYEQVMVFLHRALADLDTALAAVPAPVKTAISAELAAEARALRDELAEYSEGVEPPDEQARRLWEFESPFVAHVESGACLDRKERNALNRLEEGLDEDELKHAVADLRLLLDAHQLSPNREARLFIDGFEISDDPFDDDGENRYFLNVQAPMPNQAWGRTGWNVEICRWVPDGPQTEDSKSAKGEPVLDCALSEPPALSEIVDLLERSGGRTTVLATWAGTPVGEALAGTSFVVTERYED